MKVPFFLRNSEHRSRWAFLSGIFALALVILIGGILYAVRAPETGSDSDSGSSVPTYYYVSDNIKDNGDFPSTFVAFYWKDATGSKTITYNGRQCNDGGYNDSGSSYVYVTIFGLDGTTGSYDGGNALVDRTQVNACHNNDSRNFTINLNNTDYDPLTHLKGVVVRVEMSPPGSTGGRAFFTLDTNSNNTDGTPAVFGALGNRAIGISRDFNANQSGFYDSTFNFGNICSTTATTGTIVFRDVDDGNKYQRKTMTFRVRPVGGSWLSNTDSSFIYSSRNDIRRNSSSSTTFEITSGSGGKSSINFRMAPGVRYEMEVRNISEMNDMAVFVPTNELYGKATCITPTGGTNELSPYVNVDSGVVTPGGTANFDYSIANSGDAATATWSVRNITIASGTAIPADFSSMHFDWTCADYVRPGVTCSSNPLTGTVNFGADTTTPVGSEPVTLAANLPPGTSICRVLSVAPYKNGTSQRRDSSVECVTIGKYPHLEARNGDVYAGGQFDSATCTVTQRPIVSSSQSASGGSLYTSYATYGVTSLGSVETFGSSGLSYNDSLVTSKSLIFSNNTGSGNNLGYFHNATGDNISIPSASTTCNLNNPFTTFGSKATSTTGGSNIDISGLSANTRLTASGTINLSASSPISAGKKIVIYANNNANIRITSNITYANQAYGSLNNIPQIIVLTDRSIVVDHAVTQLDGIYAAKKNFYTCDTVPRLNSCNTQLTVNGAVLAGEHAVPLRTYGADGANPSEMAEIFNLAPSMFLNQLPGAGSSNIYIKTLSEIEVPPRF